jgi:hypothetical protein
MREFEEISFFTISYDTHGGDPMILPQNTFLKNKPKINHLPSLCNLKLTQDHDPLVLKIGNGFVWKLSLIIGTPTSALRYQIIGLSDH